jgi:copper(I)-binding protein
MPMKFKPAFAMLAYTIITAAVAFSATAQAADTTSITIQNAWVRWLPGNLPAAGYATLTNASDKPVDLIGVTSRDYREAMLHETVSNDASLQMMHAEKATIPAHGQLAISPGGYHFMLMDAKRKIAVGDTVHLKLKFSDGKTLDAPFAVKPASQVQ